MAGASAKAIPALMYHHVNPHQGDLVTLTPQEFETQLRYLKEKQYRSLFLDDLVRFLKGEDSFPERSVVLTFDDGYLDNWVYAFPLLLRYRIKATLFCVTSWVGEGAARPRAGAAAPRDLPEILPHRQAKKRFGEKGRGGEAANWSELGEMLASGLIDVQSHTHRHRSLADAGMTRREIEEDLLQSRALIQEHLHRDSRFLSWPWGEFTPEAQQAAGAAGFEAVLTTRRGANRPGADLFAIPRISVKRGEMRWFRSRITIYSHPLVADLYDRLGGRR